MRLGDLQLGERYIISTFSLDTPAHPAFLGRAEVVSLQEPSPGPRLLVRVLERSPSFDCFKGAREGELVRLEPRLVRISEQEFRRREETYLN